MHHTVIRVRAIEVDAVEAYRRISEASVVPRSDGAVESVLVRRVAADSAVSDWSLPVRRGLLRWTEKDTFDARRRTITFVQVTGDFAVFHGVWKMRDVAEHPVISFEATFDLGIPSLAERLDPLVGEALCEAVRRILTGLLGQVEELESTSPVVPQRAA